MFLLQAYLQRKNSCFHSLPYEPTLPSSITIEYKVNPFFRCEHPDVITAAEGYANRSLITPLEVFTVLREWKNNYK